MKVVGTIVNNDMFLVGLLIKKKSERVNSGDLGYLLKPVKIEVVKKLIRENQIKDYKIDEKGSIVGINKKLSDLPMYDINGDFIDKRIEIRSAIEENGKLIGVVVAFPATGQEKKLKVEDLATIYEYCEPVNFTLRNRDNSYYITGKGDTKKEDIPVIERVSKDKAENYIPFEITADTRYIIGYKDIDNEDLVIPSTFEYNNKKYKVVSIADNAFDGCYKIRSVVLPEGVQKIGCCAFRNCENLENIKLPTTLTEILEGAFVGSYLEKVIIPEGIIKIEDDTFSNCKYLKSVSFPTTLKYIGERAFEYCEALTHISLPLSLIEIDNDAFFHCISLTTIRIPNGVIAIKDNAFGECDMIKEAKIGSGVKVLSNSSIYGDSLEKIIVSPNNPYYCDVDGVLFSKDKKILIEYPTNKQNETYIVPKGVERIEKSAFSCDLNLVEIRIPEGVTNIGERVFYRCNSLVSVQLPRSIVCIEKYLFEDSKKLEEIVYAGSEDEWKSLNKGLFWDIGTKCKLYFEE